MNKIIALVGMCGAGKSVASTYIESKGFKKIYFGGITLEKLKENNIKVTPENEKKMRESLREKYGMGCYALLSLDKIDKEIKQNDVVIDDLYSWSEYKILKEKYNNLILVGIVTDKNIRYNRISKRKERSFNNSEALKRDINEIENIEKGGPIAFADYFIINNYDINTYKKSIDEILEVINNE